MRSAVHWRLVLSAGLLVACPVLMEAFARYGRPLFPGYRQAQKQVTSALAEVAGLAPFALWDVLAAVLALVLVASLVRRIRKRRPVLPPLSLALLAVSLSAFLFVAWALNHTAPSLASELRLEVGEYSTDQLAQATSNYLEQAAELAPQVPRMSDGALERQDFFELATIAGESYEGLSGQNELFEGPTAPIKALAVVGEPLLYSGHTGIFWAPTGEACVPLNCAVADTPFIMCHEAAHRLGIASEQEANFCAFLACSANDDVRLRYAGAYNAFVYCANALFRNDSNAAQALLQNARDSDASGEVELVLADWAATSAHYAAYDGPFKQVGSTVNDNYLKSFGEQAGVRSYGLVVDYLIAWDMQE